MAVATILHLPTSPFRCGCYAFQPACVAQVWVLRTGRAYVCEGDAGATGGFRCVSGAFAAIYTGQLAAALGKEDWASTSWVQ